MREALKYAAIAKELNEVPVGAVIVYNDEIISTGYNLREKQKMSTSHAEIIAIEEACKKLGSWRLSGCTMYVTLEPCPMCAGALINSRIERVVYGARDSIAGCCESVLKINSYPFNHSFKVSSGVLEDECRGILKEFFKQKR